MAALALLFSVHSYRQVRGMFDLLSTLFAQSETIPLQPFENKAVHNKLKLTNALISNILFFTGSILCVGRG